MHCVVIGAGIVGTTTALALVRRGIEVDVLESASGVAHGASHANAGLVSPGHCFSWAEPGVLPVMLRSLLGRSEGLGVCQPWSPALWRWALKFAGQATQVGWERNSRAALALAGYSRDLLFSAPLIPAIDFGGREEGIVYLYSKDQQPSRTELQLLDQAGLQYRLLQPSEVAQLDPLLLSQSAPIGGAIYCPNDATGDAAQYSHFASIEAQRLGARFHFGETLTSLATSGGRISAASTARLKFEPDFVVVCAGLSSRQLLRPLGHDLPIYPVSGYSATYQIEAKHAPRVAAVSIPHKIAWASLGERSLRFTGFADLGIPSTARARKRFAALEQFAASICPAISDLPPKLWIGQRPMTPDALPIIGRGLAANLWLNCGHGAMGWTKACGSAELLADLIEERPSSIDASPYAWQRFGSC